MSNDVSGVGDHVTQADETIVSLNKKKVTLRSKILLDVMEYWESMRDGDALPRRAEIDPRRIEGALPYAFILEEIAPGLARFRVAGGHLNDLMGMEVRGMPLSAVFNHTQRNKLLPMIEAVFRSPSSLELTLQSKSAGAETTHAEMLILPLLDDDGNVTRALGCLVAQGAILSPPYRFTFTQSRSTGLPMPAPATPRTQPRPKVRASDQVLEGFHEASAQYIAPAAEQRAQPAPSRPSSGLPGYLRVIK